MARKKRHSENRDDMSTTPSHGDQLGEPAGMDARPADADSNEDVTGGNRMESQRSRRTGGRANDERWDKAGNFTGKGNQREGSEHPEGTGYRDGSNTEGSSGENPLA